MTPQLTPTGHVVGYTYSSRYWQEEYTVLREEMTRIGIPGITVRWSSGRETTHCTDRGDDAIVST